MTNKLLCALVSLPLWLSACGKNDEAVSALAEEPQAAAEDAHEESGHDEEGRNVELTAEAAQAAGIELAQAGPAMIRQVLPLYGTVQPNAERMRAVTARFPGVIRSVSKKVGDAVREGQTLATVESNESLQTYPVVAPLNGVITMRSANPGEHAGDAALFTVADLSTVWVELALFPRDLSKVRVGQDVRVKGADSDHTGDGKIVYVTPLGESTSQTLTARVLLDNSASRWAPGLYVTGEVTLSVAEVPVAVKTSAVQTIDGQPVVFGRTDEGFEPRQVTLGHSDGDVTEIRTGLAAGANYVARNSFVLKSELGKSEAGHEH